MKKFMNDPKNFVDDSLEGILYAYADRLRCHPDDLRAIVRTDLDSNKVSIVTGGGYGHIPLFLGYVGEGLCDGVAVGNIFTTPSSDSICRATELIPHKKGVLYILGNYTGDRINFEIAASQLLDEGIRCEQIVVTDDVASTPRDCWTDRRCIAGIVLIYKLAGACAKRGDSLDAIVSLLNRVNENMGSLGTALTSCHIPTAPKPIFDIAADEMELGMGIHGEPGVKRIKLMSSKELADNLIDTIVNDLKLKRGERVVLLVNGMKATPKDELFIFYGDAYRHLHQLGIGIARSYVGEYVTSLEMSGASITLLRFEEEYAPLLDAEASSPFISFTVR